MKSFFKPFSLQKKFHKPFSRFYQSSLPDEVISIDTEINLAGDVEYQAKDVMMRLFPKVKRDELNLKKLGGGCTNHIYRVDVEDNKYLVKVFGENTNLYINRRNEILVMNQKNKDLPFISKLHGKFKNGIVYDYLEGKICDPRDMIENQKEIAKKMCSYHEMEVTELEDEKDLIWRKFDRLLKLVDEKSFDGWQLNYKQIVNEVKEVKTFFEGKTLLLPVGFCHNDFNIYNFVLKDGKISFIDHEYASYNYISYDIANFFNEMMGIDWDVTAYPSYSFQKEFMEHYLTNFNLSKLSKNFSMPISFCPQLYAEINMFAMVANLHWIIWGEIQSRSQKLDIDVKGYTMERLNIYLNSKKGFFELYNKIEKTGTLGEYEEFRMLI